MKILAICAGRVKPLFGIDHPNHRIVLSGIDKTAISTLGDPRPVHVSRLGIQTDEQADLEVHGGLEKAVYAYPQEHYNFWTELLNKQGKNSPEWSFGQVGENLSIRGLLEDQVYVGDRWQIGDVELAVVKSREPCYKFNAKMGFPEAAKQMIASSRSGWYLRVLSTGHIQAGDTIHIIPGSRDISIRDQNNALLKKHR